MVAKLDEHGSIAPYMMSPSVLDIDPDRSMDAAAEVVDAMAMAAGGNGWL